MKTKLIMTLVFAFMVSVSTFAQTSGIVLEEGGTGPYKAVMYEVKGFKEHTIFAPQDLSVFSANKAMPVLVWANGSCANSPRGHEKFLNDIASYGYLVLATGTMPKEDAPRNIDDNNQSRAEQQVESIDWAFAQNTNRTSPFYQKIDTKNICISGMSCGGLQALANCFDQRVTSIMICNSGLPNSGVSMNGVPIVPKERLQEIHCPIIYILGGESDIAHANGMDDFKRIENQPAIAVNLPVGHGGTYSQPHGGEFAIVARAWLDWQLKGDKEAAKMFTGDSPAILKRRDWTLHKNAKVSPTLIHAPIITPIHIPTLLESVSPNAENYTCAYALTPIKPSYSSSTNRISLKGRDVFKKYSNAVFMIYGATKNAEQIWQGSGFFISPEGLAVSNYHNFAEANEILIKFYGSDSFYKISKEDILAYSKSEDYIIFKINEKKNYSFIPIANKRGEVGDIIYTIGSPKGLENTFSSGEISQYRTELGYIQITAPIDHGSSGGALINEYGEAIGITSAGRDDSSANLNFCLDLLYIMNRYR